MKRILFKKEIDGYSVHCKDEILGYVGWDKDWKGNIFCPFGDIQLSASCLLEISTKMNEINN